jgi:hypothetical protein
VTTTWVTKDNAVWEMVIVEVDVVVTATVSAPAAPPTASTSTAPYAPPSYGSPPSYQHKRHLDKHAHHH